MARVTITPVSVSRDAAVDMTTKYTAITTTHTTLGLAIPYEHNDHLLLIFKNGTTVETTITVVASTADGAYAKGLGNGTFVLPASGEIHIMGIEQVRYANIVAGVPTLYINVAASSEYSLLAVKTLNL